MGAMNSDGAYVIVWQTDKYTDPAADKMDIYARLIDKDGKLREEWRKVKVKGHADEVLERVRMLNAG